MDYLKKREAILNGNLFNVIITLSLPIMLNNLIQTVYNITDSYFVSRIGGLQLAAITFVWPMIFFLLSLGTGIAIAGTSLISQAIGEGKLEKAEKLVGQVLGFSMLISIVLGSIGYLATPSILRFMKATGGLYSESLIYVRIVMLSAPAMFFAFAFGAIKQAEGDTVSPMVLSIVSVCVNIILDPLLIFYFDMGISGAAWATVLSRYIVVIAGIYLLIKKNRGIKLRLQSFILDKNLVKSLIKVGLPSSIGQSTSALGFVILNMFIIDFGENTMAAFGIGNRINSMLFLPAVGVGNGVTAIVGQNLGAGNIDRVKETVKKALIIATSFSIFGTLVVNLSKKNIVALFTDNNDIYTLAVDYLTLISLTIVCLGVFQIIIGLLQGGGHTKAAMFITMSRLWLFRIPLILILKRIDGLGSNAVWYAMVSSNFLVVIVAFAFYQSGIWKKKVS